MPHYSQGWDAHAECLTTNVGSLRTFLFSAAELTFTSGLSVAPKAVAVANFSVVATSTLTPSSTRLLKTNTLLFAAERRFLLASGLSFKRSSFSPGNRRRPRSDSSSTIELAVSCSVSNEGKGVDGTVGSSTSNGVSGREDGRSKAPS